MLVAMTEHPNFVASFVLPAHRLREDQEHKLPRYDRGMNPNVRRSTSLSMKA